MAAADVIRSRVKQSGNLPVVDGPLGTDAQ